MDEGCQLVMQVDAVQIIVALLASPASKNDQGLGVRKADHARLPNMRKLQPWTVKKSTEFGNFGCRLELGNTFSQAVSMHETWM